MTIKVDKGGETTVYERMRARKRSEHDQDTFMRDELLEYKISSEGVERILEDFGRVKEVIYDNDLLAEGNLETNKEAKKKKKRSIGHYEFFILRLAARRGIEIKALSAEEMRHRERSRTEKRVRRGEERVQESRL